MTQATAITIRDYATLSNIGQIVDLEDPFIFERINGEYTFTFTCYPQPNINLLNQNNIIQVDNDYFRIAQIRRLRTNTKAIQVSCEHVSYELNYGNWEGYEGAQYSGDVRTIVEQILADNPRYYFIPSDDIPGNFDFATEQKGWRNQILDFCVANGFEAHFVGFGVAVQTRRGHDYGLTIELGKNLIGFEQTETFNTNGTVTKSYEIDFIDLNKIVDANGQPLENVEFHMGDTVYLVDDDLGVNIAQRGIGVGYNPFNKALPTIELEHPTADLSNAFSGVGESGSIGNGAVMETGNANFYNGLEFEFTKPYSSLYSVTVSTTKPENEANVYYEVINNSEGKFIGVKVHSINTLSGVQVSMQAVVK